MLRETSGAAAKISFEMARNKDADQVLKGRVLSMYSTCYEITHVYAWRRVPVRWWSSTTDGDWPKSPVRCPLPLNMRCQSDFGPVGRAQMAQVQYIEVDKKRREGLVPSLASMGTLTGGSEKRAES